MLEILKPGGILVVEDGDVTSTGSTPESSLRWCADLFRGLAPQRGVDYAISHKLYHLVKAAGVEDPDVEMYRPVMAKGEERFLLKWSVEEAAPAFVGAGLVTHEEMSDILSAMDRDTKNPDILVLGPPMSLVWGRKPLR